MPFEWTINPYRGCSHACVYCFARKSHTYLDFDAGLDFDSQVVVKINAAEVLRKELAKPSWGRQHVALGTNTDPYQRAEGRYQLMPGIIGALADSGTPLSILTKGTLLARDIPLLKHAAAQVPVGVGISLAMTDEQLSEAVEPGTPGPRARLKLVSRLRDAGLPCGVMAMPILPWLSDSDEALDSLFGSLAAAGATGVTAGALYLKPGTREWFMQWIAGNTRSSRAATVACTAPDRTLPRNTAAWLAGKVRYFKARHGFSGSHGFSHRDLEDDPRSEEAQYPEGILPVSGAGGRDRRQGAVAPPGPANPVLTRVEPVRRQALAGSGLCGPAFTCELSECSRACTMGKSAGIQGRLKHTLVVRQVHPAQFIVVLKRVRLPLGDFGQPDPHAGPPVQPPSLGRAAAQSGRCRLGVVLVEEAVRVERVRTGISPRSRMLRNSPMSWAPPKLTPPPPARTAAPPPEPRPLSARPSLQATRKERVEQCAHGTPRATLVPGELVRIPEVSAVQPSDLEAILRRADRRTLPHHDIRVVGCAHAIRLLASPSGRPGRVLPQPAAAARPVAARAMRVKPAAVDAGPIVAGLSQDRQGDDVDLASLGNGKTFMVVSEAAPRRKVGKDMLARGGNAVDAAVATAFALAVVHPTAGNIGGGGFAVVRTGPASSSRSTSARPRRRRRPRRCTSTRTATRRSESLVGHRASGVPGSVAGLFELHKKHGKKPWKDVVAPAIALARDGFEIDAMPRDVDRRRKSGSRSSRRRAAIWIPAASAREAGERS